MEVYVDDMLVKTARALNHIADLEETFKMLRDYKMKLNPAKCAFGVSYGKFWDSWSHKGELRQIPKR
jgi:hypothetical protein